MATLPADGDPGDLHRCHRPPTLLGNPILEPGFGNTSSCTTCHAMASYSATGSNLDFLKSTQPFEGFVGTPDPGWFYQAATGSPTTPIVYQTDFMWQLATETLSRKLCCAPTGSSQNQGCQG